MSFGSAIFLFGFLPVTVVLYRLLPGQLPRRILFTAASLLFYAFGSLDDLALLLASVVFHYLAGLLLLRSRGRRVVVAMVVLVDLGLLVGYKYWSFLLTTVGLPAAAALPLPAGISFFTFQGISYVVDAYRDREHASARFFPVLQYLVCFPNLISGPLVKFRDLSPQLAEARRPDARETALALRRFTVGLGKKLLLAGTLGVVADGIFALEQGALDIRTAWLGAVAYALQLYFDFSGYSDMAVALGRLFGLKLPENFRLPYCAKSITDFWRRWHISLSQWFRDYLYIPLGGNRRGLKKTLRNKWVVFLATGLWHGASWTFVLWGAWHGLFATLETATPLRRLQNRKIGRIYALLVVLVGFVLFRAGTLSQAAEMAGNLFTGFALTPASTLALRHLLTRRALASLLVGAVGALGGGAWLWERVKNRRGAEAVSLALTLALLALCVLSLAAGTFQPFIYQQF